MKFAQVKQTVQRLKPYLRWVILGATLFFIATTLRRHWREVAAIQISSAGWACLTAALGITLLAHIWSGWVWGWILREFDQPVPAVWSIQVYLKTNVAKYLPGNVWHFYGRVLATHAKGIPLGVATFSVVMEPLLMAAAALLVALGGGFQTLSPIQVVSLVMVLLLVHPRVLNPLLDRLSQLKRPKGFPIEASPRVSPKAPPESSPKASPASSTNALATVPKARLKRYPLLPLLGELGFLGLRGAGFLITMAALQPYSTDQIPAILSAFSLAWLLGLVVPGAPGGLGVFEATAIALLQSFPTGVVLSTVAFYRLISTIAEVGGAGLVWIDQRNSPDVTLAESAATSRRKPADP